MFSRFNVLPAGCVKLSTKHSCPTMAKIRKPLHKETRNTTHMVATRTFLLWKEGINAPKLQFSCRESANEDNRYTGCGTSTYHCVVWSFVGLGACGGAPATRGTTCVGVCGHVMLTKDGCVVVKDPSMPATNGKHGSAMWQPPPSNVPAPEGKIASGSVGSCKRKGNMFATAGSATRHRGGQRAYAHPSKRSGSTGIYRAEMYSVRIAACLAKLGDFIMLDNRLAA